MSLRVPGRIAAILLLVLLPIICLGSAHLSPDFYNYFSVYRGYQDNDPAWFICTAASSISFANSTYFATLWNPLFPDKPVLAPSMVAALATSPRVARPMYLVVNSCQGPVFDTKPGLDDYSGLWQVFLIRFKPGFIRPVTNTSTSDPQGLPTPAEGKVTETSTVLDCPIVVIGQLEDPSSRPDSSSHYQIKQASYWMFDSNPKTVLLPAYYVYTSDPLSGRPVVEAITVTDADTQELADLFQANYAPRLADFPDATAKNLWFWYQPYPPGQLPVAEEAPWWQTRAYNPLFSPIMRYSELGRLVPASSTISNRQLLRQLLNNGLLFKVYTGGRVNIDMVQVE